MSGDEIQHLTVVELAQIGRLFDEYRGRLLEMLGRRIDPRLRPRIDPEDILQEAYVVAQRRWHKYQQDAAVSPYTFLYRIALDCLIEQWRKASRGPRDVGRESPWPERSSVALGLGLVDTGTRPTEAMRRRELETRMRQAMNLLKPSDRDILWMRHYDQLSHREIAQVLDITENATAVRYVRALERLRRLWQQAVFDGRDQS